ncbi:aminotransferase class I/II-fold pyridoxal phosphate-dependent enzyme [Sphingomonas sp. AR_OL41]|uniref:aminotransferase class I/II-fold pyridoxal phosphate-dependent enzyme n=1 Tax=Sphingomonas sp. AR_OL41 TaxID=3042729 RepID=UPI00247FA264|nr:aminotransferase class I/II-fold pyridoxal phosphate-dependent enzyme [Sphingomonas sp. AR_OL41]MDH7975923.1 aminotransferase class I/II-fold pyridoxal phosphate-dependent enzyme [Sphingomonas sp. AR_OL41]
MHDRRSLRLATDALAGSVGDFHASHDTNLLDRWNVHQRWWDDRLDQGVDPYCKITTTRTNPTIEGSYRDGSVFSGVNFASQDYLSLSSHPRLVAAMHEAVAEFGLHSAGSAALMGNTRLSIDLEQALAEFLGTTDCTLYSTGWGAGYGIIKALVRPGDHVIIDVLAHACLHEGARAATRNIAIFPHISTEGIERRLKKIRATDPGAGIMIVTEGVFSMDSDVPDLAAIQRLANEYNATLMLDVAHDLGALGQHGGGQSEIQGMLGKIDIVMGSFSKTFASNGGFVACNHPALKLALRSSSPTQTFTNAMSPISAAIIHEALRVIRSADGAARRARLMRNVLHLRDRLSEAGFALLGQASAIVPVTLGSVAMSRLMTRRAIELGAVMNLVEHPAVARNQSRWRLQVMADHELAHIETLVKIAIACRDECSGVAT